MIGPERVLEDEANLVFQLPPSGVCDLDLLLLGFDVAVHKMHLLQGLVGGERVLLLGGWLGILLASGGVPFKGDCIR